MASLEFPAPARAVNEPIAASAPPAPNHPLAARLKPDAGRTAKLQEVRAVYGSGLAMRLAGEDAMASEVARLPRASSRRTSCATRSAATPSRSVLKMC